MFLPVYTCHDGIYYSFIPFLSEDSGMLYECSLLERMVRKIHSYTLPSIIVKDMPINNISKDWHQQVAL